MDLTQTTAREAQQQHRQATSLPASTPLRDAFRDIAVGSLAGGAGKIIEYPFDTVKVRLQSQAAGQPLQYSGPLDCFKQSIARHGIYHGLYRGVSAPIVGAAIETSSLFLSYNIAQEAFKASIYDSSKPLPLNALCVAGAASGAFTSLVLTPIELVKCRVQVNADAAGVPKTGISSVICTILKENGLFGFWHGQLGTLIRETGGSAAWFGGFEGVSAFFRAQRAKRSGNNDQIDDKTPLPVWQQLVAGAIAGMSYNFTFYPADTIKSRMQTEIQSSGGLRASFMGTGTALWRDQGLKGLYRGCGITVARSAPSSAIIFSLYTTLAHALS